MTLANSGTPFAARVVPNMSACGRHLCPNVKGRGFIICMGGTSRERTRGHNITTHYQEISQSDGGVTWGGGGGCK